MNEYITVPRKGYEFDDILLIPVNSDIESREEVDISNSVNAGYIKLEVPIMSSPMKGIASGELIYSLWQSGGLGFLHRFYDHPDGPRKELESIQSGCYSYGASIGLNGQPSYKELLNSLDYLPVVLCIDVANGYSERVVRHTEEVANYLYEESYCRGTLLMSGNVATKEGAQRLYDAGADLVRVGIGPGALCTTRNVTGVGVPQLTAIKDCSEVPVSIVADGGIRNSGDIVKALAFGADFVMMGSVFAKTYESAHDGLIYGMASRRLQEEYYHSTRSIEGIEKRAEKLASTERLIEELAWGIKSAFTYLGVRNIEELHNSDIEYIEVSDSAIKKGY